MSCTLRKSLAAVGLLLLDHLGGERQQVAVDLDFHEFAAVAGRGEFAKIHLARRKAGENVEADAGGRATATARG